MFSTAQSMFGRNIAAKDINELTRDSTRMLIFLRHLGCSLSLQLIHDIKAMENKYNSKLPITFVSQGTKNYCDYFWESKYPDASVIYDTHLKIAKQFSLTEGSVLQVWDPNSMYCQLKAMVNGHYPTGPKGNIFMLPGLFLFVNGQLVFKHIAKSASEMPDFEDMVKSLIAKELITRRPIVGRNINVSNILELTKEKSQMLIFLRHLGCNLSLQLIYDIKKLEAKYKTRFPITFISQGSEDYCDDFWESHYPEASVVYDVDLDIAKSFGLKEGTLAQVLDPKSIYCSIKAIGNGHIPGGPRGNVFMLPGVFLFVQGQMVFSHVASTSSDLPDFEFLVKKWLLQLATVV